MLQEDYDNLEGIIDSYEKWDSKVIDDTRRRPDGLIDTMSNLLWSDDATKKHRTSASLEEYENVNFKGSLDWSKIPRL